MEGNRRFHLVTFDLDGTMLNDEWAHAEANRRIGAKLGIDCTALGDMTGYSVRTRWQALCRQADVTADVEEIARDHFRITLEIIRQARIPESAGLTRTLRALRAAGYTLAVVSSSDEDFVRASGLYEGEKIMIHTLYDEETGWTVVNVVNQDGTFARLNTQQSLLIGILAASLIFLAVMIRFFTKNLTGSVRKVVSVMRDVEEGKRDSRIRIDSKMPREVETIAVQYNNMMDRLDESVRKEQELGRQKQKAEITALEAQINPHFLYNILDTINWIAIGKKDFEISRAISALAAIMRYGIDNSNGVVTIRDEYEWLKQYLLLQQTRLRDGFESRISIQPEAMDIKVHKLLIQPFVENAVMHGFKGIHRKAVLGVEIEARGESGLKIEIYDNGRGMPEETVARLNRGEFPETDGKSHIGMKNAMERIKIYYGASSQVHIESRENEYTRVIIRIQETSGDTADEDNCCGR